MSEGLFREHWPTSADVYLRDDRPRAGSLFRNPDLASTYRRLVQEAESTLSGREGQIDAALNAFYSGFVAEAVDGHCRNEFMDSSGVAHRGPLPAPPLAPPTPLHHTPRPPL